jgi:hypothetical protein
MGEIDEIRGIVKHGKTDGDHGINGAIGNSGKKVLKNFLHDLTRNIHRFIPLRDIFFAFWQMNKSSKCLK